MKKKPKKQKTVAHLKNKVLWPLFSKYIRLKYAKDGMCQCVTCKKWLPAFGKGCVQAGHFIPGRHNSVLYDERQVYPQCYHCNVHLKGNTVEYYTFMLNVHGKEVIDELRDLDKQTKQYKRYEIEEMIDWYRMRVDALETK